MAAALQIHAHGDFGGRHHGLAGGFGVARGAAAVLGHQHIAQVKAHFVGVQMRHARVADGGENAAEVGIAGEKGGFHQRRVGDGIGHLACFGAALGIVHLDGDEFGGAFAIAHNGLRQFECEAAEHGFELLIARVGDIVDFVLAAFAGGHHHKAVVGAGVAVYGDAVKR